MEAKGLHRIKLLEYLENPDNEWLDRTSLAEKVLEIAQPTLYQHFTSEELTEIEIEALNNRRKRYTRQLSEIDKTVLAKAKTGHPVLINVAYDRFQGPVIQRHEVSGKDGKPIAITSFPPEPSSLAEWEKMVNHPDRKASGE